jgi:hypothetical protein
MKNLYLIMAFAFIFTPFAFADNPGVEDVAGPVVEESAPAVEEEVVTEEATTSTSDASDD